MATANFILIAVVSILNTMHLVPSGAFLDMTRVEFATRLAEVEKGASKTQVEHLLGIPQTMLDGDAINPIQRSEAMRYLSAKDVWYYGGNEIDNFPTLGQVHFDADGKVIETFGGRGAPIKSENIEEESLREYLRLLHKMPIAEGHTWDPSVVIKIANAVIGLGKEEGLAVVGEYLRISPPSHKVHQQVGLVLRLLHEVPTENGYFPDLALGRASHGEPQDLKLVPRFPIHLVDDIPVLMVTDYLYFGDTPQHTREFLDWYKVNGVWREARIEIPSLSDEKLEGLKQQVFELAKQYLDEPRARLTASNVYSQLARLKTQE